MELPFLKNKNNNQGGSTIERKAESTPMLPKVAEEILDAFHRKDNKAFKEALAAFLRLVREEDQQDG